jgi:membrane-bound inhibitor of C-type lysozyme
MNTRYKIFGLVVFVVLVIIFSLYKNHPVSEPTQNTAVNNVTFYCEEGTFQASFGKTYVTLNFASGTNILLPQAISGSGIRYELGSTTFIGEGDKGFLTEGTTTTYTNCIAGNVQTNGSVNTYTDMGKTFSFSYPNQFTLSGGDIGYSQDWSYENNNADLGMLFTKVIIPRSFLSGKTNFGEAKFTVGTSADPDAVKNCLINSYGEMGTTTEVTINNQKFTKINFTDAGAGNLYDTTSYRTILNGQCYAIEYIIHSSNIYNYSPDQGVKEFDKAKVTAQLESMVQSFSFLPQ